MAIKQQQNEFFLVGEKAISPWIQVVHVYFFQIIENFNKHL